MKTVLIVLSVIEVLVLVVVLAGYLITIAATLRRVSHTLGLVTFGVRAIEKQTEPLGPLLRDINGALEEAAVTAGVPAENIMRPTPHAGRIEHGRAPEVRT